MDIRKLKDISNLSNEKIEDKQINIIINLWLLQETSSKDKTDELLYQLQYDTLYLRLSLHLKEVSTLITLLKDKFKIESVHKLLDDNKCLISIYFNALD